MRIAVSGRRMVRDEGVGVVPGRLRTRRRQYDAFEEELQHLDDRGNAIGRRGEGGCGATAIKQRCEWIRRRKRSRRRRRTEIKDLI